MQRSPFGLPARWSAALEGLAARPFFLVCVLLAVNALVHPYRGLHHDARLYAAQIRERVEPGCLSHDLYLRYGSQDSYSVFSSLLAPLVARIGLEPAFFAAYLASKLLFFAALARLVLELLDDRLAAVLSLLFLAMAPLPFGGNEVFHLNESFLTPRIAASALVLFALERTLSGRHLQSAALIALGLLVHPLMAFGGGLVIALWALFARLGWRWLLPIGTAVAAAGALVVFYQPLGRRVFGYMDEDWRSVTYQVCFFVDPAAWTAGDWLRIAACAASACLAWAWRREARPFAAALLVAAGMGVAGNLAAANFHYRLLIQASPYRTLWLLETLAIPLGFAAAARLWSASRWGPFAALAVVVLFTADWNHVVSHPLVVFVLLVPLCVVWQRGLGRVPASEDWPARAAAAALAGGVGLLLAVNAGLVVGLLRCKATFDIDLHPVRVAQAAGEHLYKLPLLAVFVAVLAASSRLGFRAAWAAVPAALWLAVQGGVAWLDASPEYQARHSVAQRHVGFVSRFLAERGREAGRTPCVYWTADLRDIWFRGGASAYFHSVQLSGCAFNRGTAVEGRRRSRLVRTFEVANLRKCPVPQRWWHEALESLYEAETAPRPSEAELLALCGDEGLDYVILTERFDGLYRATDGVYYIYDCARLRGLAGRTARAARAVPKRK